MIDSSSAKLAQCLCGLQMFNNAAVHEEFNSRATNSKYIFRDICLHWKESNKMETCFFLCTHKAAVGSIRKFSVINQQRRIFLNYQCLHVDKVCPINVDGDG